MKLAASILALTLLLGCQTTGETPEQREASRTADHQRQAEHEQRIQADQLRNRFKRYTTAELRVMHARYAQLAGINTSKDAGLNPAASAIWGNPDRRNTEQLIEVERELLRRYKLGDTEAQLPNFQ